MLQVQRKSRTQSRLCECCHIHQLKSNKRSKETNQHTSTSYVSSPARLYSTVLQTMVPHVHADTKTRASQEVLINRIIELEEKCNAVHEQQAALRYTVKKKLN